MNSINGKVTIIIPVYNGERYIDRCLEKIVNQTYDNIEIIVAVGKSKDLSLEKCMHWQKKDDRLVILSRKDYGLGDARNTAIKIATGEYITYIDIDDFVEPHFIEELVRPLINNSEIEMSCCGFDRYFEDMSIIEGWNPNITGEFESNFDKYYLSVNYGVVWNKMFRKNFLLNNDLSMYCGCHEDDAFHMMIATKIKKIYFVDKILYHYYMDNINSLNSNPNKRNEFFDAMRFSINYIKEKGQFDQNYHNIRRVILDRSQNILNDLLYDSKTLNIYKEFMVDIFPEVIEEQFSKKNNLINIKKTLFLFGAGNDCKEIIRRIGTEKIKAIIDNNPKLKGMKVDNLPVISLNDFIDEYKEMGIEYTIIISSRKYYYEIASQLRENNILNYISPDDYFILEIELNRKEKNFILINTPEHTNIGDHAIAEAEKKYLKKYFPDYQILEVTDNMFIKQRRRLKKIIQNEDVLIITGGGYLGSLWMIGGEVSVRNIITDYPLNKKIIFPQSIFYENNKYGKSEMETSKKIYEKSTNLTIFVREKKSYEVAQSILDDKVEYYLVPDIVLSLKGYDDCNTLRKDSGIFLKKCKESVLSDYEKQQIEDTVKEKGLLPIKTTMHADIGFYPRQREEYINRKLQEIKGYKIVVTDTLHCMIFCAITGTPCIAINNISKKVEGVFDWIKELPYMKFISSVDVFENTLLELCEAENYDNDFDFDFDKHAGKIIDVIKEKI